LLYHANGSGLPKDARVFTLDGAEVALAMRVIVLREDIE
jgi:hypothetical protein